MVHMTRSMLQTFKKIFVWPLMGLTPVVLPTHKYLALASLGSETSGWVFDPQLIRKNGLVYSFGLGRDISFDIAVMAETQANVHGFDPTPGTDTWLKQQKLSTLWQYHPWALSNKDTYMRFFIPRLENDYNYSLVPTHKHTKNFFKVPSYRLRTIQRILGHAHLEIDVLKMDIEGGEYAVLMDMMSSNIRPKQLLVEFHHRYKRVLRYVVRRVIETLLDDYELVYVSDNGCDHTFIRKDLIR